MIERLMKNRKPGTLLRRVEIEPRMIYADPPAARPCSVPLQDIPPAGGTSPMPSMVLPSEGSRMPHATMPAPPCERSRP